jgi:hypothetical protein
MREFFRIEQIADLDVLNRVATVEFVLRGGPWSAVGEGTWPSVDGSRSAA